MNTAEQIWHEYHRRLAAFIRSKVPSDVADDLLQDVFAKIHSRIESLKENTRLESWLFQITRNTVIDYYRSRRITDELPDWIAQNQPEGGETTRKELMSCLESMIRELPDKYRIAVQLSEIEGKTQQELAELESISLSGAKSRVQRGRGLLKAMLHECCRFELNKNYQVVSYEEKEQDCKYC